MQRQTVRRTAGQLALLASGFLAGGITLAWVVHQIPGSVWSRASAPAEVAPAPPPITVVAAPGRIDPDGGVIRIGAPIDLGASVVRNLFVHEGDLVREGDVLAELDTYETARTALDQAERHAAVAQARLDDAQTGSAAAAVEVQRSAVALAQAQLGFAERDLSRSSALVSRGDIATAQHEEKQLASARAALGLEQAERQLDQAQAAFFNGVKLARAELAEATAAADHARAEFERTQIRAPRAAQVLRLLTRPGEQIGTTGLCELGDTSHLYVRADIYEADIRLVRVGQPVEVTGRALAQSLTGRVAEIGLLTGQQHMEGLDPANPRGSRVVEVRVLLDPGQGRDVPVGSEVAVRIDVSSHPRPAVTAGSAVGAE